MSRFVALLSTALVSCALLVSSCARNPVTGKTDVTMTSEKGEIEQGRKANEEVIKIYGVYADQNLQDYINQVGQKLAAASQRPELEWHFTIVDSQEINAFALPGGYIYITRGILAYLNNEAELAAVLGHEIGHVCARHQVRQQTQQTLAGILGAGAAIFTGNAAVADLANIGGTALLRGYGRDMELEADHLGAQYIAKTGYDPQAMIGVIGVLKNQEVYEMDRARQEGREPRIYHGVFATHPSADERLQQAVAGATPTSTTPNANLRVGADDYLRHINGLPFGTSKQQGTVRDNRFYHAGLGITVAFPKDWVVENQQNRLLIHSKTNDAIMQMTADRRPDDLGPREYLQKMLGKTPATGGEELNVDGLQGYAVIAKSGSPLDGGHSPVRVIAIYKDKLVYIFKGASRSNPNAIPEHDRIFLSTAQTLRALKPTEFPLTEPFRIRVVKAPQGATVEQLAQGSPIQKDPVQQLRLLNDLYPNKNPDAGKPVKVVN
ncbi:MAG TPA: M48 family metalloprotease [Steroidobacteraceae bacterium]|jgi:predicted Zn-dependent protease|nr:M48 family metalloprotease [Steroidobacteraceae bacterium]